MQLIIIAFGGAIGSVCRYLLSSAAHQRIQGIASLTGFPLGTLLVNAIGSFLIGIVFMIMQQRFADHQAIELMRGFIIIGFLGGFTTFSAFSLETLHLLEYGLWGKALLNIIASLSACISAAFAGVALGRWIA